MKNQLTGFAFEDHVAHGAIVHIRDGVSALLDHRAYTPSVRVLVAEAMAAMPLLATHLNFEGRINLQFQGEGRSRTQLLVAQIDHQLQVRAMAKAPSDADGGFRELLEGGILALMMEPRDARRPASQALVLIRGERLEEALEGYFEQSEQLPTLIRLAVRGDTLSGFLLQRLPLEHAQGGDDEWEHLRVLASTLGRDELLDTEPQRLLQRLFADAPPLRVFEPREIKAQCRCSHAGISTLLLSLGREEVDEILADQGRVAITCEFCGREYVFETPEVAQLFAAALADPGEARH
jgi:molecular chaperone Hsp33